MRILPALLVTFAVLLSALPARAEQVNAPDQPYYVAPADLRTLGADEARNVEKVRRAYLDFLGNNLQGILGLMAPGASWQMLGPGESALFKEYNDENLREWFTVLGSSFKYDYMHINGFVVQGNTVVAFGSEHGIGRPSGRGFNNNWVQVWTFSEGKVVQVRIYADTETLLLVLQPR